MKFECCKATSGSTGSIVCIKCKHNYHIQCLYPSEKKNITAEFKRSWCCPECSSKQPRQLNNDNTPIRGPSSSQYNESDYITAQRGGSCTVSPPVQDCVLSTESIRNIVASEVSKIKNDITSYVQRILLQELKPIKDEITNIKSSLNFFTEQFTSLTERLDKVEKDIKSFKSTSSDICNLTSTIAKMEKNNNMSEQWSRRSNIEIYGIPERKNENLLDILKSISNISEYKIDPAIDIDFITRVAPKKSDSKKIKPIVVRFLARYKKDNFLSRVRKLKLKAGDIGYTGCNNSIYFNEHLTSLNKSLLHKTKTKAREKQFAYVWVKNCAIFARRNDTSPVISISDEQDLNKLT